MNDVLRSNTDKNEGVGNGLELMTLRVEAMKRRRKNKTGIEAQEEPNIRDS